MPNINSSNEHIIVNIDIIKLSIYNILSLLCLTFHNLFYDYFSKSRYINIYNIVINGKIKSMLAIK